MKNSILTLLLATTLIAGCGLPRAARGDFNLALCGKTSYIALHVVVNGNSVTVTDANPGPGAVEHLKSPVVFKAAGKEGEYFKFVTKGAVLLLKVKNGHLEGKIIYASGNTEVVAGVKHSLDVLIEDGINGFQGCRELNGISEGAGPDTTASSQ